MVNELRDARPKRQVSSHKRSQLLLLSTRTENQLDETSTSSDDQTKTPTNPTVFFHDQHSRQNVQIGFP